jgi:hypothetical protein
MDARMIGTYASAAQRATPRPVEPYPHPEERRRRVSKDGQTHLPLPPFETRAAHAPQGEGSGSRTDPNYAAANTAFLTDCGKTIGRNKVCG